VPGAGAATRRPSPTAQTECTDERAPDEHGACGRAEEDEEDAADEDEEDIFELEGQTEHLHLDAGAGGGGAPAAPPSERLAGRSGWEGAATGAPLAAVPAGRAELAWQLPRCLFWGGICRRAGVASSSTGPAAGVQAPGRWRTGGVLFAPQLTVGRLGCVRARVWAVRRGRGRPGRRGSAAGNARCLGIGAAEQ